jgi:hypothetical protein
LIKIFARHQKEALDVSEILFLFHQGYLGGDSHRKQMAQDFYIPQNQVGEENRFCLQASQ